MIHEFQELLDSLAEELDAAVIVEHPDHLILASAMPAVTSASALRLSLMAPVPDPCRPDDVVIQLDFIELDDLVPLELHRHNDRSPGVGLTLRDDHGEPIGRVWMLTPPERMNGNVLAGLRDRAPLLRLHLERLHRTVQRVHEMNTHDVRAVLDGSVEIRERTALDLVHDNHFPADTPMVVLVTHPGVREPGPEVGAYIERVLRRVRVRTGVRQSLHLARADHGALLVTAGPSQAVDVRRWATELLTESRASVPDPTADPIVAVGEEVDGLVGAAESYRQALRGTAVAHALPEFAPIAMWSELGIYGVLADLPLDHLALAVPSAVRTLQAVDDQGTLLRTL